MGCNGWILGSDKVISALFKEKARPMLAIADGLQIQETLKADARFQGSTAPPGAAG